ncbi:TcpQ domain-containing protein [Polaromonas aquatica]|uniref:TcpQ domain-containing protein n=1 Tax=Polaromonas aquatica TaxID=332657 RepID=A0ABW1TXM6_9BURK
MKKQAIKLSLIAMGMFLSLTAAAQQGAKTVDAPYVPAAAGTDVIPVKSAPGFDDVIAANPFTSLMAGKQISVQLQIMANESGWQLIWEAADFNVEQKVAVSSDFVKALTTVIESANLSGSRLKATFYKGNKTVRVMEF